MVDRSNLGLQLFVHLVTLSKTLIDAVYILDYMVYKIFCILCNTKYFGLHGIQTNNGLYNKNKLAGVC